MRILPESGIANEMICQTQVELLEQQKQEYKLIGSMRKVPGHTLFSFNVQTGEIKPVKLVREASIGLDGKPVFKEKITVEKDCYYEQALNRKNFIKRLKRRGLIERVKE
jgi:hypothetical protein